MFRDECRDFCAVQVPEGHHILQRYYVGKDVSVASYEVSTMVLLKMQVSWDVAPYQLVNR